MYLLCVCTLFFSFGDSCVAGSGGSDVRNRVQALEKGANAEGIGKGLSERLEVECL